jgi:polynucleotide 5'-hydroxyl-kinase GRC3/NOL9
MTDDRIFIPTAWETLEPERLTGTILVIGASDRGKSTLVRWLVEKLLRRQPKVGWLDGDIGQSTLGVPSTMNLAVLQQFDRNPPQSQGAFFVGATSPRGHMLPTLVGVELLKELALKKGAAAVVIDTTGLVAEDAGGGALKQWKIELLRPGTVLALQPTASWSIFWLLCDASGVLPFTKFQWPKASWQDPLRSGRDAAVCCSAAISKSPRLCKSTPRTFRFTGERRVARVGWRLSTTAED